ncbi:RagB/SusD family nutrient uptake outer membrane protein [Flammeovirga pectinis]|uniref:RagB/SusD family nutrient uptake outer membrane protein n=2 Tax=Flammeovirga pectinis TaxID=2494373 RepID=A0A3S9NZR5_9BACT|nr:RagB/SusD family nutrient uptake outer membrane protein [Flammeovirga pectinis]
MATMTIKNIKTSIGVAILVLATSLTSCVHQLDTVPVDPREKTKDNTYTDLASYQQGLSKLYAGYATTGQQGPAGDGDLGGIDEGASQYLRRLWEAQELPTDEAINGWTDPGQPSMSFMNWVSTNTLIEALYNRVIYQVTICNQYLRDTKDAPFEEVKAYRAQARFLRAFSYWHALDLFGNIVPFVTENDNVGSDLPNPAGELGGTELFDYIEAELLAIIETSAEEQLIDANAGLVGQANKGAAYMLLGKLYLNAGVYINQDRLTEAKKYTDLVVSNYTLVESATQDYTAYETLFLADNYLQHKEIIFAINFDGNYTQTYGGTTYLVCASVGGEMDAAKYGIGGGWGGNRSMPSLYELFEDGNENQIDPRGLFFKGNKREVTDYREFTEGYGIEKFKNMKSDGSGATRLDFVDTNFPVFRLADALLMQTEIDYRLSGSASNLNVKKLWDRVGRTGAVPQISEEFLLAERARELYWEGHRRTDLRRFGQYSNGTYVAPWSYKGGVVDGKDVDSKYELYPLPASDVGANPNLKQNPNY